MRKFSFLILVAILLTSCSGTSVNPTATQDAGAVMTAVQQTVIVDLTNAVALTPSATASPTVTLTPLPSATPIHPTPTNTLVVTATMLPTNTVVVVKSDQASLVSQSVPDNYGYYAGHVFNVTWTFKNEGTTAWTTGYAAKFATGDLMGATQKVYFNKAINPGETISITVTMTAPSKKGTYQSNWYLRNENDINFFAFYVIIQVI